MELELKQELQQELQQGLKAKNGINANNKAWFKRHGLNWIVYIRLFKLRR